jgi:uncharacterized membrane-anchored protein
MEPTELAPHFPVRQQLALHHELHARPTLPAPTPCVVSSWVQWGMEAAAAEAALAQACLAAGAPVPAAGVRHHVLLAAGFALKFERHGEFVSWQVNRPLPVLAHDPPDTELRTLLDTTALPVLPAGFVAALSAPGGGELLAATHVVMLRAEPAYQGPRWLQRCQALLAEGDTQSTVMGAYVGDDKRGALLTQLRLAPDGFTRYLLLDLDLAPEQAAREAQRLCEIEAYRMLAMLGFPVAQAQAARLRELESALLAAVDAMANQNASDDAQAFDSLSRLAAEVEHGTARTRYRLSATRAYHQIVRSRLAELREERIPGVRTLSGFLLRRFSPAMSLCDSTDARLTDMAERINRAVSLARVRVEQRREQGNQELLRAMARRAQLQLRLQQAVEGLSVVVISYYVVGLLGYLAKGAAKLWPALQPDLVTAIAVLPVLAGVTVLAHRLRRRLGQDEPATLS